MCVCVVGATWAYMDEMVCSMVPVPKHPLFTHKDTCTQTSKAARLCGAPVCPRHTETDRASFDHIIEISSSKRQENPLFGVLKRF